MSPELIQKGVAITLITGGIGGGYFALVNSGEGTLSQKHLVDGRELVKDWEQLAREYAQDENTDQIEEIPKKSQKASEKLQKWCEKYGNTYYLGATEPTYRSYYTWCLQRVTINDQLTKQKFKWDENHWGIKLKKYKDNNQQFIKEGENVKDKTKLVDDDIKGWCTKNKEAKYKYLGDNTEYQMRIYCYWTDEELEEAKKSPTPKRASD